jgi:hypothetical protein
LAFALPLQPEPSIHVVNFWSALSDETQLAAASLLLHEPVQVVRAFNVSFGPGCTPIERCYQRFFLHRYVQIYLLNEEQQAMYVPHHEFKGSGRFTSVVFVDPSPDIVDVRGFLVNRRVTTICQGLLQQIRYTETFDCTDEIRKGERDAYFLFGLKRSDLLDPVTNAAVSWDYVVRYAEINGEYPNSDVNRLSFSSGSSDFSLVSRSSNLAHVSVFEV